MKAIQTIGRYRVDKLLGSGAMGEVYRAYDPVIDRPVAIKLLRSELVAGTGSEQLLQRFRREARAAGRRFHPNIVAIWDFGDDDGMPFIVMEYVDGRGLDEIIRSSGPLATSRSIAIVTQVLSALGFAHKNGIVHRDIKPSNIIVLANDDVKVADFGIARIDASDFTIVGDLLGTPAYMAPEQLSGTPVDYRTDLFAVGVILFEMLSGVKPFRGKSITEIISFMENRGPEDLQALNPAVPDTLRRVIIKSLAFDPAQRYADAAAFSKAIFDAVPALSPDQQLADPSPSLIPTTGATAPPAARASQTSPGDASFTPELLREVERDLATFIGPMASIAVKRAARQTGDLFALYELLGRQVNSPRERSEFLARGRQRTAAGLGRPRPSSAPKLETPAKQGPDLSTGPARRANIVAIETDLTRYIGPIARILVKRELEKFETLEKLCLVLAAHIPDEGDRRAFLNAHGAD
jgi:eukaryotic-like serine/threonine-protein kinase